MPNTANVHAPPCQPQVKRKYSDLNSEDDVLAKAREIIKKRATASGNGGCRNYDSVRGLLQEVLHCVPLEQWQQAHVA